MNLLVNAVQAIDERGTITITTRVEGKEAVVEIADTGKGIDPLHLPKIFSPGFTTKGAGTGLGLSISEKIVRDHGGTIGVTSAPGGGSTFTVRLPIET
jgi:two-component system NtrC family sensor kinase